MSDNQTNITSIHREIFNAITTGEFNNFALFSCFLDGEPAAAIVAVNCVGDDYLITPLFVSVTEKMILTDHNDRSLLGRNASSLVQEILACDGLEILPVHDTRWNEAEQGARPFSAIDDNETWCEPCDADKAHFWSVYGHLKTGGINCIDDFATESEALAFAEALYRIYPHLAR